MRVTINGWTADIKCYELAAADLLNIEQRHGGSVPPLEYIEWYSRWQPIDQSPFWWLQRCLTEVRKERWQQTWCCCEDGPDEHGCRNVMYKCHRNTCDAIRDLAESVTVEQLLELSKELDIYDFDECEVMDGD